MTPWDKHLIKVGAALVIAIALAVWHWKRG